MLQPKVLCLNQVVRGFDPLLSRTLGEHINLRVLLAPDLCDTEVDPHQLEQVIMNLALNARDAMPHGGELMIETANVVLDRAYCRTNPELKLGPHVLLAVSDTGCGMDKELHVKQSGGSVWVNSEPGRGSTFKIYLPVHCSNGSGLPSTCSWPIWCFPEARADARQMSSGTRVVVI